MYFYGQQTTGGFGSNAAGGNLVGACQFIADGGASMFDSGNNIGTFCDNSGFVLPMPAVPDITCNGAP